MGQTAPSPAKLPSADVAAGEGGGRGRRARVAVLSVAMLLGVAAFTLFALWESLSPPAGPVRAGGLQIQLTTRPYPARVGENQVEVDLRQDGQPVSDARVELRYTYDPLTGANVPALADVEALGSGRYRGAVAFSRPGPWHLTVLVKRSGLPDAEAAYTFNLAPDPSAVIAGQVRVQPGLEARIVPGAALFVIARRGAGPPVAVKRFDHPRFPLAFTLSQADAMAGGAFEGELLMVARLRMDGRAGPPAPGDLEGRAPGPVRVGTPDLVIVLDRAQ